MREAEAAIERLDAWLEANGWAGWDPYDVRGTRLYRALIRLGNGRPMLLRAPRRLLDAADAAAPFALRRLLRVRPTVNAHGIALLASGHLARLEANGDGRQAEGARACLDWLLDNPSPGYAGLCWGYPFDWQSRILIPAGMPSGFVSVVAGEAFLRAYELLGDDTYVDVCHSICRFLTTDLHVHEQDTGICFSYTPVDRFRVHNTNLQAAAFLARVEPERHGHAAARAAAFTLAEQRPDGGIAYWAAGQDRYNPGAIDHYHTGFGLRALHALNGATGGYDEPLARYRAFYADALWSRENGAWVPRGVPGRTYPLDVQAAAEALLCCATLGGDLAERLPSAASWIVGRMQTPGGWFASITGEPRGGRPPLSRIPYLRWGQAAMLLGLGATLCAESAAS